MADEKLMKVLLIAEDVVWFDWSGNDPDAVHAMEQLRLAVQEATALDRPSAIQQIRNET